jgi:predicted AlkP superfamily pyrophosphatase or phosphodiesterase
MYLKQISILLITIVLFTSCSQKTNLVTTEKALDEKPYLILISLDGFRWDYVDRFKPTHLSEFIKNGTKAESLIPCYPSKTFPNHYSIATGMYPDNHGILGNLFYNYEKANTYSIRDRETVEDGTYYGGKPIWVNATQSGLVSASYFFVGSEADVQGTFPNYYYRFDGRVKNELRVEQAIKWLELPEKERPQMITMYFSDMDNMGHRVGPNNDKLLKKTLNSLDAVLGKLFKGIKSTGLPVNVIIVSDHGMKEVPIEKYIPVEMIQDEALFFTINNGSIVNIHPKEHVEVSTIYEALKEKEKDQHFKVYLTEETPNFEQSPTNKNWGALQIIPDEGYYFTEVRTLGMKKASSQKVFGQHGYDPNVKDMHGIFYANGPIIKKRFTVPSVKNIHIYPLMCEILGLKIPADVDGKLNELEKVLVGRN